MFNPVVIAIPFFAATIGLEAWFAYRAKTGTYDGKDAWNNILIGFVSVGFGAIFGIFIGAIYTFAYSLAALQIFCGCLVVMGSAFLYRRFRLLLVSPHKPRIARFLEPSRRPSFKRTVQSQRRRPAKLVQRPASLGVLCPSDASWVCSVDVRRHARL